MFEELDPTILKTIAIGVVVVFILGSALSGSKTSAPAAAETAPKQAPATSGASGEG